MTKKLSVLEKYILRDVLRYMMNECEKREAIDPAIGRLSMLSADFYATIVQSITEKLDLPLDEFRPAVEELEREVVHE